MRRIKSIKLTIGVVLSLLLLFLHSIPNSVIISSPNVSSPPDTAVEYDGSFTFGEQNANGISYATGENPLIDPLGTGSTQIISEFDDHKTVLQSKMDSGTLYKEFLILDDSYNEGCNPSPTSRSQTVEWWWAFDAVSISDWTPSPTVWIYTDLDNDLNDDSAVVYLYWAKPPGNKDQFICQVRSFEGGTTDLYKTADNAGIDLSDTVSSDTFYHFRITLDYSSDTITWAINGKQGWQSETCTTIDLSSELGKITKIAFGSGFSYTSDHWMDSLSWTWDNKYRLGDLLNPASDFAIWDYWYYLVGGIVGIGVITTVIVVAVKKKPTQRKVSSRIISKSVASTIEPVEVKKEESFSADISQLGRLDENQVKDIKKKILEHWGALFGEHKAAFESNLPKSLSKPGLLDIQIHYWSPTPEYNYWVLCSAGMFSKPMNTEDQSKQYCELMMFLDPEHWKPKIDSDEDLEPFISQIPESKRSDKVTRKLIYFMLHFMNISEIKSFDYVWATRSIQLLSHLPTLTNKLIKPTDFIEKGDEDHVIMGYEGWLIKNPDYLPQEMTKLKIDENITINFYAVVPIRTDEIEYAKKHGGRRLVSIYNHSLGTDVTFLTRPSVNQHPHSIDDPSQ